MAPRRPDLELALEAALRVLPTPTPGWRPWRWKAGPGPAWLPDSTPTVAEFVRRAAADPRWAVAPLASLAVQLASEDVRAADPLFLLFGHLGHSGVPGAARGTPVGAAPRRLRAQLVGWRRDGFDGEPVVASPRAALARLARLRGTPRLVALFTLHRSGFVREAALDTLGLAGPGLEGPGLDWETLPFVIWRLGDVVAPVRAAAARAIEGHLSPLRARALLAGFPDLERERRRRHFEHAALADQYTKLLVSQARTGLFLERLDDPDPVLRRTAFRFALETEGTATLGDVARRAVLGTGGAVVDAALKALSRLEDEGERRELLTEFARARGATTRRAVARAAPQLVTDARSLVAPLLVDPAAIVRQAARFVDVRPPAELAAELRALAERDGPAQRGATLALAELGDRSQLGRVRAWLTDSNRRRQRDGVTALARMLGAEAVPELRAGLSEPGRVRAAATALLGLGATLTVGDVAKVVARPATTTLRAALDLASGLSRTDELDALLHIAAAHDPREHPGIGPIVERRLLEWLRRTNGRRLAYDRPRASGLAERLAPLPEALRAELLARLAATLRPE